MAKKLDPNHPRADLARRMKVIADENNPKAAGLPTYESSSSSDGEQSLAIENAGLKSENKKLMAEVLNIRKKLEQAEKARKESQKALIQSEKSCEKHKQNLDRANARITVLTGDLDRSTNENADLREEITGLKGNLDRSTAENADLRKKIQNLNAVILAKPKERIAVADSGAENIVALKKPANLPANKSRLPAAALYPASKQHPAIPTTTKIVPKQVVQQHKLVEKPEVNTDLGPKKAVFNRDGPKKANAAAATNV